MRHRAAAVLALVVFMLTAGCGDDEYPDVDTGAPVNRTAETC